MSYLYMTDLCHVASEYLSSWVIFEVKKEYLRNL